MTTDTSRSAVERGPLSVMETVYQVPDGRRCCVVFAGGDDTGMFPLRASEAGSSKLGCRGGELRVGFLDSDGRIHPITDPAGQQYDWIAPEILLPVGTIDENDRFVSIPWTEVN